MTHARRAKEIDEGPVRHIVSLLDVDFLDIISLIPSVRFHQAPDHSWQDIITAEEHAKRNAQAKFKADAAEHVKSAS